MRNHPAHRVLGSITALILAIGGLTGVGTAPAAAAPPAPAPTPPMGWNDWSYYQCGINETLIKNQAAALVSTGLAAKGYNTVTIDDCWMASARDSNGNLVADPTKFPSGIASLASYVHGLGLRFGIYEDAGTSTCGGYPGSWNHWTQDANRFASWGVDYLKLDGCNVPSVSGQTTQQTYRQAYSAMSQALAATGRPIVYSESAPAYFQGSPTDWYTVLGWVPQYGNLWREGYDVALGQDNGKWSSIMSNYGYNVPLARYAGPGHWNDPDFLLAGDSGLTSDEQRSQVALWSMMSAPLISSTDLTALSSTATAILGNSDVIAVDQDSLGSQAALVSGDGNTDILAKRLVNGDRALALLNRTGSTETVTTSMASAGFTAASGCTWTVKDLWSGTSTTSTGSLTATIPAHGTAIYRITAAQGCGSAQPTGQIYDSTTSGAPNTCVDNARSTTTDGNEILLYQCTGNPNQRWSRPGDGTLRVQGKCLHVAGGSTTPGAYVDLWTCDGSGAQQWTYQADGTLVNPQSGLCLDALGGQTTANTRLGVWTCGNHQINQTWTLPS